MKKEAIVFLMYLPTGLVKAIIHKKLLFAALFIIQVVFIAGIASVNLKYQTAIMQDLQNVILPLQNANYDDASIKEGAPFISEFDKIISSYERVVKNLWKLISYQLAMFLFIGTLLWSLTHQMLENKFNMKKAFITWVDMMLRALTFIAPAFFICYLLIRAALAGSSFNLLYLSIGIAAIAWYFMIVSLTLSNKGLKETSLMAFRAGTSKAYRILPLIVGFLGIAALTAYLISLSLYWNFWVMVILVMAFVLEFVIARIFIVAAAGNAKKLQ